MSADVKSCCDDRAERVSEDHEYSQQASTLAIQLFVIPLAAPDCSLLLGYSQEHQIDGTMYRPPPLIRDVQLEYSVLLI